MAGFECSNDAFAPRQLGKSAERLAILDPDIGCAAGILEERMLGSDGRIVEASRYRPAIAHLPFLILEQECLGAMKDSRRSAQQGGAMLMALQPLACGFDPD